ncbi:Na/Pi symporter [Rapidithrix thailandica]|uniref:Na/Pi symporter n=1 Tax=Rapidithrix thailandica TaxID=413964 RepID=A0AAW9SCS3_9BACT
MIGEIIKELKSKFSISTFLLRVVLVLLIGFLFLTSLELLGISFQFENKIVQELTKASENPFVAIFIGLLATAIMQSSSTVTSLVVTIVASGMLSIHQAIPIVMGANIGTTVTSTFVSLGHITQKKEFRKAISAATLHDFFNIITVMILFPLEYFTGWLSSLSLSITNLIPSEAATTPKKPFWVIQMVKSVEGTIAELFGNHSIFIFFIALIGLFVSIKAFASLIKRVLIKDTQETTEFLFFSSNNKSLATGFVLTSLVQSSSLTSSMIVPLVATNKISLSKAFPYLMGANIGTTVTALIAAVSTSNAAISLAIAHLLFNVIGVILLYPLPQIRRIPIFLAKKLGNLTVQNRLYGFLYLILIFFIIPFILISVTN